MKLKIGPKNYLSLLFASLGLFSCKNVDYNKDSELPNIVVVFIDDQGYGDLSSYGATGFRTPFLDQMASEGMRFTNFYSASSVCSPSRAALLTGSYPPRVGIPRVLFPGAETGLSKDEVTLAELVKQKGYRTGIIGKWHLGHHKEFLPLQHGFDEFFGLPYSNDMWPVDYDGTPLTDQSNAAEWKINSPQLPLIDGNDKIEEIGTLEQQDELTVRYTERAVEFINKNSKEPFFLYVPHTMAHVPLGVSKRFKGKSDQGLYGDIMMELDWSVGEIMKALEANHISENTLVIFTSDNGPWLSYGNHGGSAAGLREGKTTSFEGGFRVPCIMKWPKVIKKGVVCDKMASTIDLYPTIAHILGAELPDRQIDGVNIISLLKGQLKEPVRNEFYYYDGNNLDAVRYKHWKYVFPHEYNSAIGADIRNDGWPGKTVVTDFEGGLYDLRQDAGERYDLKDEYPEIVNLLEAKGDSIRKLLGDKRLEVKGSSNRPPGKI